jgi:hypothetical protein
MDMKKHMLIYFFIFMLVDREKEWSIYKMEVIIKKGEKYNKPHYTHAHFTHIPICVTFLVTIHFNKKYHL